MEGERINDLTGKILGSAIEVHRELGPGLLESTYRACLMAQLAQDGLKAAAEVPVPILYKGTPLGSYRADIVVEDLVLLELKTVEQLEPVHTAQILTYLRHCSLPIGLLINFNAPTLMRGVRRFRRFN